MFTTRTHIEQVRPSRDHSRQTQQRTDAVASTAHVSRNFHIWNLTRHRMMVDNVRGNATFDGRPPAVGTILKPGQIHEWRLQFDFLNAVDAIVDYMILGDDNSLAGRYSTLMHIDALTTVPRWSATADHGFVGSGIGMDQIVMDPDAIVTDTQLRAQASMLRALDNGCRTA